MASNLVQVEAKVGLEIRPLDAATRESRQLALEAFIRNQGVNVPLSRHPAWLAVLKKGLGHQPYLLEAVSGDETRGILPLAFVNSYLFGRYLVSLPYLNYGGVIATDAQATKLLVDRAVELAKELNVKYLELRQGQALEHPALTERVSTKVMMRLELPGSSEELWKNLSAKVRNQVRKGQKNNLTVHWGGMDLLPDFYDVFSRNMRDLGTPVYGNGLFRAILERFPEQAEFCVLRGEGRPIAAALLLHGWGLTEVPSASSLREFNSSYANMLMYWHLLERTVQRGQAIFDFGRSTRDGNTYRFKEQWGAKPEQADWLYHVRVGNVGAVRPDNPRYQRMIRIWQKLPLSVTRMIGPRIVRGIP